MKKGSYFGTATVIGSNARLRSSKLESNSRNEPIQASRVTTFDSQVDIRIVSYRTRLTDADNVSAKAAIDGLVHAGVIHDDSPKEVREVTYSQTKVKNKSEEKTVITITRV